ncbi:hypothetical protein BDL97_16G088600 [Sphagnum fallax]|nr:hypothetical protein BDL97_16G088600 [Sphagnum fallax]KAH8938534.1 hypothetical protein BDL97_16G088600 [Sphagnum fallax]
MQPRGCDTINYRVEDRIGAGTCCYCTFSSQVVSSCLQMVEPAGPAASNTPAVDGVGNAVPGSVQTDIFNTDEFNEDETKADLLFNIKQDPKLGYLLDDWEKQFKVARDRIETKTSGTNNAENDLYPWIGLFSVFQGVVLTAVAQSSTFGCRQSWAPASLSIIASLVTVVSVHFKLINYNDLKANLLKEISQSKIYIIRLRN